MGGPKNSKAHGLTAFLSDIISIYIYIQTVYVDVEAHQSVVSVELDTSTVEFLEALQLGEPIAYWVNPGGPLCELPATGYPGTSLQKLALFRVHDGEL